MSLRRQIVGDEEPAARSRPAAKGEAPQPAGGGVLRQLFSPDIPTSGEIERGTASETFMTELQRQILGNILNLPAATLQLAREVAIAGRSPLGGLPLPPDDVDLRVDPDRVIAGVRTVGRLATDGQGEGDLGELFSRELEEVRAARAARRKEHPTAAVAGEIGGDVGSLLVGRLPFARIRQSLPAIRMGARTADPSLRQAAAKLINHPATQRLFRGLSRTGEAGIEGAAIAALNEGDPLETAAFSSGLQAGSSLSLEALRHARSNPGLAGSVFLGGAVLQMLREATPGGRDWILESLEDSAKKTAALVGLGLLSGAAGGGRVQGEMARLFPRLADALTAVPRGSIQSLAADLLKEERAGRDETQVAIETLNRDPDFFGEQPRQRIARAIRSSRKSVSSEVNRLMRSRSFRERLAEARQKLAAPLEEASGAIAPPAAGEQARAPSGEGAARQSLREQILSQQQEEAR